ncbi:MAG: cupin domain-containing protein [Sandaracinaceae bacterium]|nr:cupin domain-containing protein [Sandaracinaceae bacterium]
MSKLLAGHLLDAIPASLPEELIEVLVRTPGARVERIVSRGHASPPGFWYDQDEHELVAVLAGEARLELEGETRTLGPGDWVWLEAHRRHRVAWTTPDEDTIWLAVFLEAAPEA